MPVTRANAPSWRANAKHLVDSHPAQKKRNAYQALLKLCAFAQHRQRFTPGYGPFAKSLWQLRYLSVSMRTLKIQEGYFYEIGRRDFRRSST
jgi:hypothetical protein